MCIFTAHRRYDVFTVDRAPPAFHRPNFKIILCVSLSLCCVRANDRPTDGNSHITCLSISIIQFDANSLCWIFDMLTSHSDAFTFAKRKCTKSHRRTHITRSPSTACLRCGGGPKEIPIASLAYMQNTYRLKVFTCAPTTSHQRRRRRRRAHMFVSKISIDTEMKGCRLH